MCKVEETNEKLYLSHRVWVWKMKSGFCFIHPVTLYGVVPVCRSFFTLQAPLGERESLFPPGSLSDSWVVRKYFAKYNSVVFITQIIEKYFWLEEKVK